VAVTWRSSRSTAPDDRVTYPGGVLVIRADLVDEIVAHARRDHPNEACGFVAGLEGSDRPERFVPMRNAAAAPDYPGFVDPGTNTVRDGTTFFIFDSAERLALHKEMTARDEVPVVIYHSHTQPYSEAYPSVIDVESALEPDAHYVVVGTKDPARHEFRSFRILDGVVTEEDVDVVESYMFAHTGADAVPPKDTSPDHA
jgi:proteasome lid subunit RPN8/RPN11